MHHNPVGWFEIYVQDLDRAVKFYQSVLQVTLVELPMPSPDFKMMTFPMIDDGKGCSGALTQMEGCASGGNSVVVYFSCRDCADEQSRVEPAGGRIHQSKMSIGEYGFISLAFDVDGNMFGLHSLK